MSAPVYTVTQVNRYIKGVLDEVPLLQGLFIQGELSNYKIYPSGHHYFSLKDQESTISCVMFRRSASKLRFRPENGMKVMLYGSVTVYPRDGKYQVYAEQLIPAGAGDLSVAFEQLKEKLYREGLFDEAHKKPIPAMPGTIAVITSPAGAAVHDLLRILEARWPMAKVKVMGVRVQGAEAAAELTGAVRYANRWKVADLLIIGRGGGSMEDLWCFNDERLARAIYDSEIPVISAVGHEPDVVISDFVADLRASTPSNAAELAVPDQNEVAAALEQTTQRLISAMTVTLTAARRRLERCTSARQLTDPTVMLRERSLRLDGLEHRLEQSFRQVVAADEKRLAAASAALDAMSPLKVLSRGYAVVNGEDGRLVTSAAAVQPGERIQVSLKDGSLDCTVNERSFP